ncbi:hypothetical protein SAMN04487894_10222 [Niabella drilacis]|uniref:Uncharacterized protein n=1 Tax=Niabella drilacis (strain DSM 25811 / CCM 8410 / CCUG 62505 / LMG 26954 / E90) TaxID=1285928 RepID=A0A1G6KLE2_NIADE|nr:hypothetical protein SAMN04487894_10222 [Niabella drilacis]
MGGFENLKMWKCENEDLVIFDDLFSDEDATSSMKPNLTSNIEH